MTNAQKIQQIVKWAVYSLLIVNFIFYIAEDWDRAMHSLREGATVFQWTSEFAVSIDELAWFALLFMFELETYVLEDAQWKGWVSQTVRGVRLFCYLMLAHTIVAYGIETMELIEDRPVTGVTDLCSMTESDVSFVYNLEFTHIDDETCSELSTSAEFFWRTQDTTVTDVQGMELERNLMVVDLIEAVVWLLILLAIEIVVRLHDRGITQGPRIKAANTASLVLYSILVAVAAYWGWLSHWLYVWDEFLWIAGFAAIEMNVSAWGDEIQIEQAEIP